MCLLLINLLQYKPSLAVSVEVVGTDYNLRVYVCVYIYMCVCVCIVYVKICFDLFIIFKVNKWV